uniref:hypothetical protein n=1 Tax=Saccharothrix mutabilis TaxID=33921 RepID=UPI0031D69FAB
MGRRAWAATIAAGPADAKAVPQGAPPAPREVPALLDWMAHEPRAWPPTPRRTPPPVARPTS